MSLPASSPPAATGMPSRPPHSLTEYRAAPATVPRARQHARLVLRRWGLAHLAETAELLVSELVTNAVRASQASGQHAVRLLLTADSGGLRISVWDGAPGTPHQEEGRPGDSPGGRGLILVDALSSGYGCYHSAGPGKVVWCLIPEPPPAP
jgi:anti-sigma regulatory factor (Ser/Thr protein kinase)